MQKFEESGEPLSERRNIVVMADEAHRGQYGLTEKIKMTKNEDGELVAVKSSVRLVLSVIRFRTLHISALRVLLYQERTETPVRYLVTISTFMT